MCDVGLTLLLHSLGQGASVLIAVDYFRGRISLVTDPRGVLPVHKGALV